MREFGIGQSVPRSEDVRLVTGAGKFTDDVMPPDCARMVVVRSPHGAARIAAIRTEDALAMPGVLGVLTGADAVAEGLGCFSSMVHRTGPDGQPNLVPPYRVLAHEQARFAGDGIAIVVAETLNIAKSAAELVEIDYDPLPCVSTLALADAPGAPRVWAECPDNLCIVTELGDKAAVTAAFAAAAHVASVDFVVSRVHAAPIENRNAIGEWDAQAERFTLQTGTQNPHMVRTEMANRIFGMREDQVRVVAHDVGGGFGLKGMINPEMALVLWAAKRFGRPVRWTAERSESFLSDCHARDDVIHSELALDAAGHFLGLRVRSKVNLGAYISLAGVHCAVGNLGGLSGVYRLPVVHAEVRCLFTNTSPIGAYRGAGRPEASLTIERVIDVAARELAIDPAELRRRNLIQPDEMPYDTGFVFTYDSGNFPTGQARAEAMAKWDEFETRRTRALERGRLRGIGMAHVIEIAAPQLEEMADIAIDATGGVTLTIGTHSQGQGHETVFRQLVHEFLAVGPDRVEVRFGDTDLLPSGFGAGGSRTAVVAGFVVETIAQTIIARGKQLAAIQFNASEDAIDFAEGIFSVRGTNRGAGIAELAKLAHSPELLPDGAATGWSHRARVKLPAATFPNACHICEVEIEIDTGQAEVVGYWVCEDVGQAINPMIVKGQVHGGVAQGLGQVLGEYIYYDADSQLLTGSFMDYQMPRAGDFPYFHTASNDVPSRNNPLGIKGVGEGGTVGALPAGMNAVCDALKPLGIVHFDMPATPLRVWRAMRHAPNAAAFLREYA